MDALPAELLYEFGEFQLDPRRRLVHRIAGGSPLELTPKAFGVLLQLVLQAGSTVGKDALFDAVWPAVVVEESNLTQTIHLLRRALGEHPADHRYIVTVPGRGYRFVATVVPRARPSRDIDATTVVARLSPLRERRVVVAVGMVAVLGILAAAAASRERPAAPAVEAPAVGSPRAGHGAAGAVRPRPLPDPAAYEHVLRGHFFIDRRAPGDLARAAESFRDALALDPSYARAWAGSASVAYLRTTGDELPRDVGLAAVRTAARRAIELDPADAEGYVRMSGYHCLAGEREIARRYLAEASRVAPDDPLVLAIAAGAAATAGRLDDAVTLQRRAAAGAPLAATYLRNLGLYLYASGRLDEAGEALARSHDLDGATDTATLLGGIEVLRGDHEAALRRFETVADPARRAYGFALAYHAQGRHGDADAALARLRRLAADTDPFLLAEVHAQRGETRQALDALERARSDGNARRSQLVGDPPWLLAASPFLASLREDPRWPGWLPLRR